MDITNPLETDLNVSANVQLYALERFQSQCRACAATVDRMLSDAGDAKLSELLSGEGPFKMRINLSSLALGSEGEEAKPASASGRTSKQATVSSYQDEKRRKTDLKKARALKINHLFKKRKSS